MFQRMNFLTVCCYLFLMGLMHLMFIGFVENVVIFNKRQPMNGGAMNNYYFSGSLASVDNKFVDFEDSGIPVDIYNNEYENPKVNIESASRSIMLNSENILDSSYNSDIPSCDGLYSSQYYCDEPKIDSKTYEYEGCQKNNTVLVNCYVREGVECSGSKTFYQFKSCYYTNGYHFSVALGLSVFLGICGIDRMYLGYVGYGLFKLFTIGGFGFLWVYDILLISLQIVIPRDGSNYIVGSDGKFFFKIFIKFLLNIL